MITVQNNTLAVLALQSAARANGAAQGVAVDTNVFANAFRDVSFVLTAAVVTDGSHVVTLEESDQSGAGFAAVPADRVVGALPTLAAANSNSVLQFGARPTKRYVRVVVTTSGATTGGIFSAAAVLGNGARGPVARS